MSQLFRDIHGKLLCPGGSVVCIGAFDGLHLGHQALVQHVVARARQCGLAAVALSFEPLPREFFAPATPPPRLWLPRAKFEGLTRLGADVVGLLRFDTKLATLSADAFVEQVLVQRLAAHEVWVGPGFCFGHRRCGNLATLQAAGRRWGFSAGEISPLLMEGKRVSSTQIREALAVGDFNTATHLLGQPYLISGRVVHGAHLGRTLGYPTANLRFAGKVPSLQGIYATWVHGVGEKPWPSVSSFGTRPTVGGVELLLESHLFDFSGDLYGQRLEVEFVSRLRAEEKFPDLPSLVAQMNLDAAKARALLSAV